MHWSLQHILAQIRQSLQHMDYRISHIYHEGNSVVDRLANLAVERKISETFNATAPQEVQGLLRLDKISFPNFRSKLKG